MPTFLKITPDNREQGIMPYLRDQLAAENPKVKAVKKRALKRPAKKAKRK